MTSFKNTKLHYGLALVILFSLVYTIYIFQDIKAPERKFFNKMKIFSFNQLKKSLLNLVDNLNIKTSPLSSTIGKNLLPPGVSLEEFKQVLEAQNNEISMEESINKVCTDHDDILKVQNYVAKKALYSHLLYEKNTRLLYCPVWKAMTTTWDEYFLKISDGSENIKETVAEAKSFSKDNITENDPLNNGKLKSLAREKNRLPPEVGEARRAISRACSFMIVRHPFTRLVSAYRDKMVNRKSKVHDYLFLRSLIIHRYRTNSSDTSDIPTFPEFIQYVIDEWSLSDPRPGTWRSWTRDWDPAYYLCGPCHIDYTIVIKYENLEKEIERVSSRCGVKKSLLKQSWYHKIANTSSEASEHHLFQQLPFNIVLRLAQIYFLDIKMFGYDIQQFIFSRSDVL